ncbi:hypothetical protein LTR53_002498, partial [Teratosphaeriaceae sp. CCFEE 6253]
MRTAVAATGRTGIGLYAYHSQLHSGTERCHAGSLVKRFYTWSAVKDTRHYSPDSLAEEAELVKHSRIDCTKNNLKTSSDHLRAERYKREYLELMDDQVSSPSVPRSTPETNAHKQCSCIVHARDSHSGYRPLDTRRRHNDELIGSLNAVK